MKTKEELKQLKNEYEAVKTKLKELSEDELSIVTGGETWWLVDQKLPTENKEVPWYHAED